MILVMLFLKEGGRLGIQCLGITILAPKDKKNKNKFLAFEIKPGNKERKVTSDEIQGLATCSFFL